MSTWVDAAGPPPRATATGQLAAEFGAETASVRYGTGAPLTPSANTCIG